jgi:hypothetical protein
MTQAQTAKSAERSQCEFMWIMRIIKRGAKSTDVADIVEVD